MYPVFVTVGKIGSVRSTECGTVGLPRTADAAAGWGMRLRNMIGVGAHYIHRALVGQRRGHSG